MAKEIKITLIKSLIINTVKNETYRRGQIVKASDDKNSVVAFHEQAGDEQYHMAIIDRGIYTQVEELKSRLSGFLVNDGNLAEDPLISSEERTGYIDILLLVSDRFINGYTKTIARLAQKFVEDRIIYLWWLNTDKELAALYLNLSEEDMKGITGCLATKTAPSAPEYHFPTAIILRYPINLESAPDAVMTPDNKDIIDLQALYGVPRIINKGDDTEISYTLTGENGKMPIDDIVVRCDDNCCNPFLKGGTWCLRGVRTGVTVVTLFSRHDDTVFNKFVVRIV